MIISKTKDLPIYMQIAGQFKEDILSGKRCLGERLPSIRELAMDTQVSVITVSRAYKELERQGLVVVLKGKGYFVCERDDGAIREQRLRRVEDHLMNAVSAGRFAGCSDAEIKEACVRLLIATSVD